MFVVSVNAEQTEFLGYISDSPIGKFYHLEMGILQDI